MSAELALLFCFVIGHVCVGVIRAWRGGFTERHARQILDNVFHRRCCFLRDYQLILLFKGTPAAPLMRKALNEKRCEFKLYPLDENGEPIRRKAGSAEVADDAAS